MTRTRSSHGDVAGGLRLTARAAAVAFAFIVLLGAASAALTASAVSARAEPLAAASHAPARVKYYIVPPASHGSAESLFTIAVKTLGNGGRYMEIFRLNKGRLQPNGGRLTSARLIEAGWVLQLPADASGPDVHFGRLPGPAPSVSASASAKPSPTAPAARSRAAAPSSAGLGWLIILIVVGGLAIAACGLLVKARRHGGGSFGSQLREAGTGALGLLAGGISRVSPQAGQSASRRSAHAKPRPERPAGRGAAARRGAGTRSGSRAPGGTQPAGDLPRRNVTAPGTPGLGKSGPGKSGPGRSGPGRSGPDGSGPGGSGPGGAGPGGPGDGVGEDYPSWPQVPVDASWSAWGPPPQLHPDHPSAPVPRVRIPSGERGARPAPSRPGGVADRGMPPGPPGSGGAPPGSERWPQQPAGRQGPGEPISGRPIGPQQWSSDHPSAPVPRIVIPAGDPGAPGGGAGGTWQWADQPGGPGPGPTGGWHGASGRPQAFGGDHAFAPQGGTATATLTAPDWRETSEASSPGAVWLAQRILFLADAEAAEITRLASSRAAEIQATAVEEAVEIRRLAAEQATAVREAAEQEAERTRAAVLTLSDELGRLASHVTDSLTTTKPATRPRPQREPVPAAEPAAEPAVRPTVRPAGRPRQFNAMRMVVAAMVAMVAAATTAGTTEVALHGMPFFVFRAEGTGSTPGSGLREDQGPGQPDAPAAHHHPAQHQSPGPGSPSDGGGHG